MGKKFISILLVLILVLWAAPLSIALAAGGLASALGCELNEGSIHPCLLFGSDIGETLYTMFVAGWLTIIGIPYAVGALIVLAVVAAILNRRRVG